MNLVIYLRRHCCSLRSPHAVVRASLQATLSKPGNFPQSLFRIERMKSLRVTFPQKLCVRMQSSIPKRCGMQRPFLQTSHSNKHQKERKKSHHRRAASPQSVHLWKDVLVNFFAVCPAGQNFFKQSCAQWHGSLRIARLLSQRCPLISRYLLT